MAYIFIATLRIFFDRRQKLCYNQRCIHFLRCTDGELSEWFKVRLSKSRVANTHRGFESLALRLLKNPTAKLRSGSFIFLFYSFRRRHTVRFKTM